MLKTTDQADSCKRSEKNIKDYIAEDNGEYAAKTIKGNL